MPIYTLIPDEHDYDPMAIEADNPAQLLSLVHRLGWNAAQVLKDGEYVFTVSLNPKGFWSILPALPEVEEQWQKDVQNEISSPS
jgi:hypothetical protein